MDGAGEEDYGRDDIKETEKEEDQEKEGDLINPYKPSSKIQSDEENAPPSTDTEIDKSQTSFDVVIDAIPISWVPDSSTPYSGSQQVANEDATPVEGSSLPDYRDDVVFSLTIVEPIVVEENKEEAPVKASSDFDLADVEPTLKKVRLWVEETFSLQTNSPPPPPPPPGFPPSSRSAGKTDFGPFLPSGSYVLKPRRRRQKQMAKRSWPKRPSETEPDPDPDWSSKSDKEKPRFVGPKGIAKPEPNRRLLQPNRVTYLRSRPARSINQPDPDPNAAMGPPESRILRTAHETVKKALNHIKRELKIFTDEPPAPNLAEMSDFEIWQMQNAPPPALPEYSISRVTPHGFSYVEEVVMELDMFVNSIPGSISSYGMKSRLLEFQIRLGLPDFPLFYNLIWVSAERFMHYLAQHFPYDRNFDDDYFEDEGDGGGDGEGGDGEGGDGEGGSGVMNDGGCGSREASDQRAGLPPRRPFLPTRSDLPARTRSSPRRGPPPRPGYSARTRSSPRRGPPARSGSSIKAGMSGSGCNRKRMI